MNDFGRLLEKAIPRLRRYAHALTRDVSRADDLVQDTLVRAIAQQHYWQLGTDLQAWLFTLMHNQNVNAVRRSMCEGIAVEFDDKWPSPTAATDPTGRLSLRDLDRALARISEEQRQVILLIGLEGTSYEEAATILDVPVGTIRSRVFRGRESLRKLTDRRPESEAASDVASRSAVSKRRGVRPGRSANSEFFLGGDVIVVASTLLGRCQPNVADEPSVKAA
jgi:RNA polymerase sigma-70 factor, ECF subfamily